VTVPPSPPDPASPEDGSLVEWRPVVTGALVGFLILVASSVVAALLDHYLDDFDDSGWIYPLFVGVLVAYAVSGFVAGRAAPFAPLTNGALAGIGSFALWLPVRILIWLVRDEDKGLFSGHSPVLRPGQIFGHLLIAAALGMVGAWFGARLTTRSKTAS
jgi:hypothetical protein